MGLIDDLNNKNKKTATATATAKQTSVKTTTATETQAEPAAISFEVTEAEIKSNPAYQIVTDTKKSEKERIEALIALKAYDATRTEEENAKNLQALNQFLMYCEHQILTTTSKSVAFTNDDAFSLYDETVRTLKKNLDIFKGSLVPMVDALKVMQRARDADIAPGVLLNAVQEMKDSRAKLAGDIQARKDVLQTALDERAPLEAEATETTEKLTKLQNDIAAAEEAKARAEGRRDAENAKYSIQRDRQALSEALDQIESAKATIEHATSSIKTLGATAESTAAKLERHGEKTAAAEAEIAALEIEIAEVDAKLAEDADTLAIAKLLEITGVDFKDKRKELTDSVENLVTTSVKGFEKAMGRFESGGKEVTAMFNTVTNVGGLVDMCAAADSKVRLTDADYIASQQTIVDRIKTEMGEDAVFDPEYEKAREQLGIALRHSKEGQSLAGRTGELASSLTRQKGTYLGLKGAFEQKFMDARRLRTNAAVEVPSKLLTTTKSLELAIAGEAAGHVDDMLAELSEASNNATRDIFKMVSESKGEENRRLADALQQTIDTVDAIDSVTKELREKAKEGIVTREAMRQAREELDTLNDGLRSVENDAERAVQQDGLKKAGKQVVQRATAPKP